MLQVADTSKTIAGKSYLCLVACPTSSYTLQKIILKQDSTTSPLIFNMKKKEKAESHLVFFIRMQITKVALTLDYYKLQPPRFITDSTEV